MLHLFLNKQPWFRSRRFGYGSGLPIKWQGWVVIIAHLALILGCALLLRENGLMRAMMILTAVIAPLPIYRARTQGGWHWNWGRGK